MLMVFGVQSGWEGPVDLPASVCGEHRTWVTPGEGWEHEAGEPSVKVKG